MNRYSDLVIKVAQMQLLVQGAAFEWDKKNSWVERGRDGRFGSGTGETESELMESDEDGDQGLFSKKKLSEIVSRITGRQNTDTTDAEKVIDEITGRQNIDTTDAEKVIDEIKKDAKDTNLIAKISKTIEDNKDNPAAIAGAVAVLAAMSFLFHRTSALKTLKGFAKKNGINFDRIRVSKNTEGEIYSKSSVHLDSIYGIVHELADEELKEVCKANGISVPQVSTNTRGVDQRYDYHTRGILNRSNNPIIERNKYVLGKRDVEIDDLAYSESPSILVAKNLGEVRTTITGIKSGRKDYRGRPIRSSIELTMKNEGASTEFFIRKLAKVFLDGDLDKIVEDCTNIIENSNDMQFNLNTAQLFSEVINKAKTVKNSKKSIKKNIVATQNADEPFKELSKELTEFSLPWQDGIPLAVSKGVTDSKKLKKAGVHMGIARF